MKLRAPSSASKTPATRPYAELTIDIVPLIDEDDLMATTEQDEMN